MASQNGFRKIFQNSISHMAAQAWNVGNLDSANTLLDVVLAEANENLTRNPKDKATKDAVEKLTAARKHIDDVARALATIAVGGGNT